MCNCILLESCWTSSTRRHSYKVENHTRRTCSDILDLPRIRTYIRINICPNLGHSYHEHSTDHILSHRWIQACRHTGNRSAAGCSRGCWLGCKGSNDTHWCLLHIALRWIQEDSYSGIHPPGPHRCRCSGTSGCLGAMKAGHSRLHLSHTRHLGREFNVSLCIGRPNGEVTVSTWH